MPCIAVLACAVQPTEEPDLLASISAAGSCALPCCTGLHACNKHDQRTTLIATWHRACAVPAANPCQGLDNQTDCLGYLTYTSWIWGQAHPQAFAPEDIDPDRRARALLHAAHLLLPLLPAWQQVYSPCIVSRWSLSSCMHHACMHKCCMPTAGDNCGTTGGLSRG